MIKLSQAVRYFCAIGIIAMLPSAVQAQIVQLSLPSRLVVTAQYQQGQLDKPVILLLHGFLQTRDSPPMSLLGQSLADAGYTVLLPTLSLGYSLRNQSLACEAMHSHRLQDDVAELALWVDWLNKNAKRPLILIGFSSGSAVVMNYIASQPAKNIRGAILVSPAPVKKDASEYKGALAQRTPSTQQAVHRYRLAFCQYSYFSTETGYLSYAAMDERLVLARLRHAKVPVQIIIGGADRVFTPDWGKQLTLASPSIKVVPEADHFLEDGAEFALLEHVQSTLTQWQGEYR